MCTVLLPLGVNPTAVNEYINISITPDLSVYKGQYICHIPDTLHVSYDICEHKNKCTHLTITTSTKTIITKWEETAVILIVLTSLYDMILRSCLH
jgi:hypothetical protein